MNNIAAIVLAGGDSTRLGQPKQLIPFRNTTLLEHAIGNVRCAGIEPVTVVLGAQCEIIARAIEHLPVELVVNPFWREGIGTSISVGIRHVQQTRPQIIGALIILCDQPLIGADHLRELCDIVSSGRAEIAATEYPDRNPGVPAVFARNVFVQLADLRSDQGAQSIIANSTQAVCLSTNGQQFDVDTPEQLATLSKYDDLNFRQLDSH
jgi:molybdenum cofactor cytidylyltransferase